MATSQQQELTSFREQLERLEAENRALRAQLCHSQRLAAVGTMTAMVAHEFNNILTPIINYARMARRNPKLTDKAIARAADGGERATEICRALLGIARDDSAEPTEVRLAELIQETLAAMARKPERDGVELVCSVPDGLAIRTHRVHLQQVLLNLLLNAHAAIAATGRRPGWIRIAAERDRHTVRITLGDSGVGIPPENLEHIFDPFFSTKGEHDGAPGGCGLGLAVCKEIMIALGGSISVDSTVGEGTTFTVRLPAA